jgi:hypothetical protein
MSFYVHTANNADGTPKIAYREGKSYVHSRLISPPPSFDEFGSEGNYYSVSRQGTTNHISGQGTRSIMSCQDAFVDAPSAHTLTFGWQHHYNAIGSTGELDGFVIKRVPIAFNRDDANGYIDSSYYQGNWISKDYSQATTIPITQTNSYADLVAACDGNTGVYGPIYSNPYTITSKNTTSLTITNIKADIYAFQIAAYNRGGYSNAYPSTNGPAQNNGVGFVEVGMPSVVSYYSSYGSPYFVVEVAFPHTMNSGNWDYGEFDVYKVTNPALYHSTYSTDGLSFQFTVVSNTWSDPGGDQSYANYVKGNAPSTGWYVFRPREFRDTSGTRHYPTNYYDKPIYLYS